MSIASLFPALPLITLFSAACAILLVGLYTRNGRMGLVYGLTQATLIATVALVVWESRSGPVITFHGMFIKDRLSDLLDVSVCLLVSAVLVYSRPYLRDRGMH
ncbi:MAG: NADH:ubiquinone oxidoreductase subunit N, partial [Acidiferrobacteraceae bacterium]